MSEVKMTQIPKLIEESSTADDKKDQSSITNDQHAVESNISGSNVAGEGTEAGASAEKKTESSELPSETDNASELVVAKDQEVILIQDTGFTIKIAPPNSEPFDLQVSSSELVHEIYQVLMDREDTCHRTCFTLQLDGQTLDTFCELKNIEGLKEGVTLKVVEESYNLREARIHVKHIRDLLKSLDSQDAYNGVDCSSLSFLNSIIGAELSVLEKKARMETVIDCQPPEFILPGCKDRPIVPLHSLFKDTSSTKCLKVLTVTGWNPPPGRRKLKGDLLYLYVETLEDKKYHITSSTRGFYINLSSFEEFNPKPAQQNHLSHSLIDLLSQISPAFKRNFQSLLKKRAQKHPFERVTTPYQVYSWLAPVQEHTVDSIRAEEAFSSRLGYEEHIPGQMRDWNEELQTTKELPSKTLPERLLRERAIFKVHSDFVLAAMRGAMSVVDGNIMAINPSDDTRMQMFLWNNIFFSLGFDVKDHYKDFGGDTAAYVAPANDLQGVKAYSALDQEGLYTLGTAVIDYRGYRVTAQSIIPGILEREQEQSVVYGSIDFGKTVSTCDKYKELLQKTAQSLKICPHKVVNDKGEEIELFSSVECKGIVGNDSRHYILDLLRTFPPDANYLPVEGEALSKDMQELGYPHQHRHKLATLRQELIDAFVEQRYVAYVKLAAFQFQQLRLKEMAKADSKATGDQGDDKKAEAIEADEAKKLVDSLTSSSFEENGKEIVRNAAATVGSLSDSKFEILFNPDVFQLHVKHAQLESDDFKKQKQLVKDAAEFLVLHQIPSFMKDCLEHNSTPIDGQTLTDVLHQSGINMRYLGQVLKTIQDIPQLQYLKSIATAELISRAAKHLFKVFMQGVDTMSLSVAVSHYLNCFLGAFPTPKVQQAADELLLQKNKKKNKKKSRVAALVPDVQIEWTTESPKSLWNKIAHEVEDYYSFKLDCESIEDAAEKFGFHKVSLLRNFSKKVGIQLLLHEYQMDNRAKAAFSEEDVLNLFPVIKHLHPKATDAYHVFTSGQNKIQQGLIQEGYELTCEALNLLNNVYGAMHPEIAACSRLLARLNYIMGDFGEAMLYQQRAVLMSERALGIDHPNTITEYAHLALYCFANNQVQMALKLLYRAKYLAILCHGEDHPEATIFDTNIGVMLHVVGDFDSSLRFLLKALELNARFFGAQSLKVALTHHLVARTYSCKGDFRAALQSEKACYEIYKALLGEENERTRESAECVRHLVEQAVKLQKAMNQLKRGEKLNSLPAFQIFTPSPQGILETLNLINGIVYVHIRPEDLEKFRVEMLKRQEDGAKQSAGELEITEIGSVKSAEGGATAGGSSEAASSSSTFKDVGLD